MFLKSMDRNAVNWFRKAVRRLPYMCGCYIYWQTISPVSPGMHLAGHAYCPKESDDSLGFDLGFVGLPHVHERPPSPHTNT